MTEREIEDAMLDNAWDDHEELLAYRAIGTVEQLEWCKDASHWKSLYKEKLEQYEAIGTIERFRELTEKAEPKKHVEKMVCDTEVWVCPVCGNGIFSGQKYCDECGQAISDGWE